MPARTSRRVRLRGGNRERACPHPTHPFPSSCGNREDLERRGLHIEKLRPAGEHLLHHVDAVLDAGTHRKAQGAERSRASLASGTWTSGSSRSRQSKSVGRAGKLGPCRGPGRVGHMVQPAAQNQRTAVSLEPLSGPGTRLSRRLRCQFRQDPVEPCARLTASPSKLSARVIPVTTRVVARFSVSTRVTRKCIADQGSTQALAANASRYSFRLCSPPVLRQSATTWS
jgi:hypothetical protein